MSAWCCCCCAEPRPPWKTNSSSSSAVVVTAGGSKPGGGLLAAAMKAAASACSRLRRSISCTGTAQVCSVLVVMGWEQGWGSGWEVDSTSAHTCACRETLLQAKPDCLIDTCISWFAGIARQPEAEGKIRGFCRVQLVCHGFQLLIAVVSRDTKYSGVGMLLVR